MCSRGKRSPFATEGTETNEKEKPPALEGAARAQKPVQMVSEDKMIHTSKNYRVQVPQSRLTPLRAIRAKCYECMGGDPYGSMRERFVSVAIDECVSVVCPNFLFRFGKNPNQPPPAPHTLSNLSKGNKFPFHDGVSVVNRTAKS